MKEITTIFFDIGGVCLTNGWDFTSREKSARQFSLEIEEIEKRHEPVSREFETGKLSLDEYLNEVIFFKERSFSKKDFIEFMYSQSCAFDSTIEIIKNLSTKKKYHLATINNESQELNKYRINKFKLVKYFRCFFSSCYLGVRKPEPEIFYKALNILQKEPGECLFIDDREENFQSAKTFGIHAIHLDSPKDLKLKLKEFNIEI